MTSVHSTATRSWFSPGGLRQYRVELQLAAAAVGLRGALLLLVFVGRGVSWTNFLLGSDSASFLAVGKTLFGLQPASALSLGDSRVFPGWPLLFGGLLACHLPEASVLVLTLFLAALVPVLFYRLTEERVLSWYLVYFPPAWLLASVCPMSEAAFLALALAGLLALKHRRYLLAGAAGGALILVRAFGIVWPISFAAATVRERAQASRGLLIGFAAGALALAGLFFINWSLYHDPLRQLHVYAQPLGQLNISAAAAARLHNPAGHWGWPFLNLLRTPWVLDVPRWKIAYIYAHAAALVILAIRGGRLLLRRALPEPWQNALVLGFLGNAALIVSTGPYWGFYSFDRYFIWGLPGAIWLARPWLGSSPRWHALFLPLSFAAAALALWGHARGP